MSMSRKDFELLARIIKDVGHAYPPTRDVAPHLVIEDVARCIAIGIHGHSATFDKQRFLKACGVRETTNA